MKPHHTFWHYLFVIFRVLVLQLLLLVLWGFLGLTGYFFFIEFPSPINLLVGFPLVGVGVTMGLMSLYEIAASLLSWDWSAGHCPFCQKLDILNN